MRPSGVPAITLIEADQAPLLAQPYYAGGDPGPIVAALAHVPELLVATMPFLEAVLGPSVLPSRTKEIVILRTSARARCRYCVDSHTVAAADAGLSPVEIRALVGDDQVGTAFADEGERAVIDWCDAMVGTGPVDPGVRTRLVACLPEHEVVELSLLAATTLLLNRFCTALELPTSEQVRERLATLTAEPTG